MVPFHALHRLRELNNANKHRFLLPALISPSNLQPATDSGALWSLKPIRDVASIDIIELRYVSGVSHDNGTEVVRVPIVPSGPDPQVEMEINLSLEISLSNGDPFVTWDTLRTILIYVEKEVFEGLAPAFID